MTQRVVGCSVVTGIYSFLYPLLLYMVLYLYHHTTYLLSIYIPFGSFSCHITGYLYFPHFVVEMFVYYSGIDGPTIYIYMGGLSPLATNLSRRSEPTARRPLIYLFAVYQPPSHSNLLTPYSIFAYILVILRASAKLNRHTTTGNQEPVSKGTHEKKKKK